MNRNCHAFKLLASLSLIVWMWLLVQGGLAAYSFFQRYRFYNVITGSMSPAVPVGSVIVVDAQKDDFYEIGDIITFSCEGEYITHRITDVKCDEHSYYLTRGDANSRPDGYWTCDCDIIGKVIYVVPAGVLLILQYCGMLLVLSALALLFGSLQKKYDQTERLPRPHIFRRTQWHITHKRQ